MLIRWSHQNEYFILKLKSENLNVWLKPKQLIFKWLDSELIPRLLENFENWKHFKVILLSVKNDAYRQIFWA